MRDQAGVTEGELGLALLCVGAGALPAMLLTGRVIDRFGLRIAAWLIGALGVAGLGVSLVAHSFATLVASLLLVGITSGAADVAMNSVAGRAEQRAGRPVITRAHGMLSGFVVIGSLATSAAAGADLTLVAPFALVTVAAVGAGVFMGRALPSGPVEHAAGDPSGSATGVPRAVRLASLPLLLVGVLGALAFASESTHQSWSALFAADVHHAGPGTAALAPALFATVVAATRLAAGSLGAQHALTMLMTGGLAAGAGGLVVAASPGPLAFVAGLVLAGAGTAVLFPTVLGIVSRAVDESERGRATSLVTTVSYLGFLLGPAYVGAWAGAYDLRVAMVAAAVLAIALALLTPVLVRGPLRHGSAAR